jgi:hypothetical protein
MNVFKSKLKHLLNEYNEKVKITNSSNIASDEYYILLNNSNKYFCYIFNKNDIITSDKSSYKIMYFFKNDYSHDFFVEIDDTETFLHDCLLEGYIYESDTKKEFLATDILSLNDKIITNNYNLRLFILLEVLFYDIVKLQNLNGHININIHPYLHSDNQDFVEILSYNFKYNSQINSRELVDVYKFNKIQYVINNDIQNSDKIIEKTNLQEVYKVYNSISNDYEGLLYIKTLQDSGFIHSLFNTNTKYKMNCSYINKLNKWTPILDTK